MSGEAKDHKTGWDPLVGPPKRPLCNGNIGGNAAMGQLTFLVLRPIRNNLNDQQKTSICSREELQREFQDVNMKVDDLLRDLKPVRPERSCKSASIQRYLGEALRIRESTKNGDKVLNARGEWGRACLKRLAIVED